MKYARLVSETQIDTGAPVTASVNGTFYVNPPADVMAGLGWFPLDESPAPTPPAGSTAEAHYALDESTMTIMQSWQFVPITVSYSKAQILRELAALGLYEKFREFLAGQNQLMQDLWAAAVVIDSTDPMFGQALDGIAAALGVTREQVDDVLSRCVSTL